MNIPEENISFLGKHFRTDPATGRFVEEYDPNVSLDETCTENIDPFAWNHFGKSMNRYHVRNTPLHLVINHEYYEHSHT